MPPLRRLFLDCLMLASVAGLCALPFLVVGCEPWRPLAETLADLVERLGIPLQWY